MKWRDYTEEGNKPFQFENGGWREGRITSTVQVKKIRVENETRRFRIRRLETTLRRIIFGKACGREGRKTLFWGWDGMGGACRRRLDDLISSGGKGGGGERSGPKGFHSRRRHWLRKRGRAKRRKEGRRRKRRGSRSKNRPAPPPLPLPYEADQGRRECAHRFLFHPTIRARRRRRRRKLAWGDCGKARKGEGGRGKESHQAATEEEAFVLGASFLLHWWRRGFLSRVWESVTSSMLGEGGGEKRMGHNVEKEGGDPSFVTF